MTAAAPGTNVNPSCDRQPEKKSPAAPGGRFDEAVTYFNVELHSRGRRKTRAPSRESRDAAVITCRVFMTTTNYDISLKRENCGNGGTDWQVRLSDSRKLIWNEVNTNDTLEKGCEEQAR